MPAAACIDFINDLCNIDQTLATLWAADLLLHVKTSTSAQKGPCLELNTTYRNEPLTSLQTAWLCHNTCLVSPCICALICSWR